MMLRRGLAAAAARTQGRRGGLIVRSLTDETKRWAKALNEPLSTSDPEIYKIIEDEKIRQKESLVLIASENFTSK